ncbi:phosphoethanolamine--lipid A transferase [Vibrio ponticus]|uniref:Phosphoethanolamine--lipid A transferase n=1 Tax=Vibrio ponticus TaxID=265668 RepID=A0A3N3E3S8_9VIBR|nr:phosphoethanolamine--lipid A transferase [Vibrio ponticus]ROV61386.1 phosphoethanolamine--lipid A transferase [Vibrio ponticus]
MMQFRRFSLSYLSITALLALYFALVLNLPIYKELEHIFSQMETVHLGFIISIPFFFWAALNFIFNLFSWPYFTKPFFILLLVSSALVSYAGFNYGTIFDADMITNIMQTDSGEANAYLSTYSVVWFVALGLVPAILLAMVPIRSQSWLKFLGFKFASMAVSLLVIVFIAALYYQDYASVGRNNSYLKKVIVPTQFVGATVKYINKTYFYTPVPYKELGVDAHQSAQALAQAKTKPMLLVLVVGETARSQNYQLNGYPRETNPYTEKLNVVSFQDVRSCGTATAVSLPCMFSLLTHDNYDHDVAVNQDNAIDILKRAGIGMVWEDDDGGDKTVAKHIERQMMNRHRVDATCDGNTCYDMVLLENFEQNVAKLSGNRMIALHLIGSHGPTYYKRYPKEMAFFQPDCPRADIENCSEEQIRNSYDNTIRYTDYVLSQLIERLTQLEDKYNTALIYLSDHGESLGEDGLFLHGAPYAIAPDYQKTVPLIVWMSPEFQATKNIDIDCLKQQAKLTDTHSHDNLFHSLLGVMDVQSEVYQPKLDIFSTCRSKN